MRLLHTALLLSLTIVTYATGQESNPKAIDWAAIERHSAAGLDSTLKPRTIVPMWINHTDYLYYYTQDSAGHVVYYLVNASTGKQEPLIASAETFVATYASLTGDKTLDPNQLYLYGIKFEGNNLSRFGWRHSGHSIIYDRQTHKMILGSLPEQEPTPKAKEDTSLSPDGRYVIYGKGYNLWVKDTDSGQLTQLTHEGKEGASFTNTYSSDTIRGNARGRWWGAVYLVTMRDEAEVEEMTLVNQFARPRPKPKTFRMPMPFDSVVPQNKLWHYDTRTGHSGFVEQLNSYAGGNVELQPHPDEGVVYALRRTRLGDTIALCRYDVDKGELKTLIEESTKPHLNLSLSGYRVIDKGAHILWWSERTGYGAYYLYNSSGKCLRRLTPAGKSVASSIVWVDEKRRELIYAAYGVDPKQSPYYRHYYKVGLDGRGQTDLGVQNANYTLELSPTRQSFVTEYSRVDMPPTWVVGSLSAPQRARVIHRVDSTLLRERGWVKPEIIRLLATDQITELEGILYRPSHFDKSKRYPLVSYVYPGPQDDQIPRSFTVDDSYCQSLAELGCMVLQIGPRGSSPLRGRAFYCFGYGNLRDYPLADSKYCLEQVAQRYPQADLSRVGIWGHSGGGFQTVASMCTYPDFYKVGFSASGNHDNNIYISWWGEVFHGKPHIPTTIELASKLQGKLMLVVGAMDSNVPPASTLRLVDALIAAGKDFDFFVFPKAQHDLESPYYRRLLLRYFAHNLLGYPEQGQSSARGD